MPPNRVGRSRKARPALGRVIRIGVRVARHLFLTRMVGGGVDVQLAGNTTSPPTPAF
jgi:hypothetical protein